MTRSSPGLDAGDAPAHPSPRPGDRVGSYRLLRLLGEGATRRVFEVEHATIGRRAAMKILSPEHAQRSGSVKRLFAEAQAVNRISHPNIVEVTDLVEADRPDGHNAIVMELLEGQSLGALIQRERRVAPERFLPILIQVTDALAAAHAVHIVHRDLKPENIFLTARNGHADFVKLLDFGLAKSFAPEAMSVAAQRSHATAEGVFVGTPAYASPEQGAGRPVDHRTDIYSLGVILYELLCGRLPFEGRNFGEYLVQHLTEPPPPAPADVLKTDLGRALDAVARRCLAKEPEDRYRSAEELRAVFAQLATAGAGAPVGAAVTTGAPARRGWVWLAVAGLAVGLTGAWWTMTSRTEQTEPETVERRGPVIVPLAAKPTVVVRFVSDPPGAETRVAGSARLLGLTPFHHTFFADERNVEIEMKLRGFSPRRFSVSLREPATVGGPLVRAAPPPPAAPPRRPPPKPRRSERPDQRQTTLNPFGQ